MPDEAHKLLMDINKKDRRFKFFQTVFIGLIMILLFVLLTAQQATIAEIRKSQKEGQARADERNDVIVRLLNCIALIPPDQRTNIIVNDCTENAKVPERNGAVQPNVAAPKNNPSTNSQNTTSTSTTTNTTNNNTVVPVEEPEQEPIKIIGVEVCLPLTDFCVRQ